MTEMGERERTEAAENIRRLVQVLNDNLSAAAAGGLVVKLEMLSEGGTAAHNTYVGGFAIATPPVLGVEIFQRV